MPLVWGSFLLATFAFNQESAAQEVCEQCDEGEYCGIED
jgi:hypothetical protein